MDEPNGVGDETYGDDCFEIMDEIVQKYLGPYSDADADACQWYWMEGVREHEPYIEDLFDTKCRDVPQPVAT